MIHVRTFLAAFFSLIVTTRIFAADVLPREQIDPIAKPVVDGKWAMGFVVGMITEHNRQVIGYGSKSDADPTTPDGQTVYEIGSVSKTFTATLLADAITRGDVALDDPAQKYLPAAVKMPVGKDGKAITLLHLTTHSSGLLRMPTNFAPADPGNPYADYTLEMMYENLSAQKLLHEPGESCLYSNLGVALLGNILAGRAGKTFEGLLLDRICVPLKMQSTRIVLDDSMRKRLAPPFDPDGGLLKNWDLPAFAGAGGIRSTVDDMLNYVAAEIESPKTKLPATIELSQKRQREFDAGNDIALGWFINKADGYYWHNGQTGGYHSFVAFDPKKKVAVVVLCNTAGNIPDAVGIRVMQRLLGRPAAPLKLPQTVTVDEKILDRYVGEYKLGLVSWLTITRSDNHLKARLTSQEACHIYPASDTEFFWKVVNARVTFEVDADGKVKGLVLHQNGKDMPAEKTK